MRRQGGLSLIMVAVVMAALAALAMAALFSLRHERNLFAEGWQKVTDTAAAPTVAAPAAAPAAPLRKCTIDGRTVVSNVECGKRGTVLSNHDSRGIEAPRSPPAAEEQPGLRDKMLERALP